MKFLSIFTMLVVALVTVTSCKQDVAIEQQPQTKVEAPTLDQFAQQNVAFYDARIRSLDESSYVRELYFVNFSDQKQAVRNCFFDGHTYSDDGTGRDNIAGDGVFTSVEVYQYDDRIRYKRGVEIRSVLEKPVIHPDFKYRSKLSAFETTYELRKNQLQTRVFEVTCKITFGGGGCRACDWFGGSACDYCFSLSECTVTVGF